MSRDAEVSDLPTKARFRKADLLLIVGLLVLAGFVYGIFLLSADAGARAVITVDGDVYGTYVLDKDQTIPIRQDGRVLNIVVIENGYAYMKRALCPDHLCIKQGKINRSKESIVCLPNRLVVSIEGAKESEIDSMVK